ncbi:MAG: UDP-N-acetylglucosamine 1-carboxyvinyltransferase [Ignavibacteria bacterium]
MFLLKGGKPLYGTVRLSGAKNSASKLFIASLLTDQTIHLKNCPCSTIELMVTKQICEAVGTNFKKFSGNEAILQTKKIKENSFPDDLSIVNRIGILTAGPLLKRTGEAKIPKIGGDKIGRRPVDFHLDALQKLGADVREYNKFYELRAKSLYGANITLPFPSVGATENIIMTACLAEGTTYINNAAVEPEVIDLILLLQKMGAIIDIHTDRKIVIKGVNKLGPASHSVLPDRLEAASLASAAIASKGSILIKDARQCDMISFLNSVRRVGADYEIIPEGIKFFYKDTLKPIIIETNVHPGFMTDWQPPFIILLTQAIGVSIIHETVYENRFGYVSELKKMGADIELYNTCLGGSACRFSNTNYKHSALIKGPSTLKPAEITVPDIRAGFSYLIAAILAKGESIINGAHYIDRGYENIDEKLRKLGVNISRVY